MYVTRLLLANELIVGTDRGSVMVISGTQESYAKALSKAMEVRPNIEKMGGKWWVIGATCGYWVTWDGKQLVCDCYAGRSGMPCYHAAAVALREGKDYGIVE